MLGAMALVLGVHVLAALLAAILVLMLAALHLVLMLGLGILGSRSGRLRSQSGRGNQCHHDSIS